MRTISRNNSIKIIGLFLLIIICFCMLAGCYTRYPDYSPYISPEYENTTATIFVDEDGFNSIKLNETRDIVVLQLTDTHLGNGSLCVKKDQKAIEGVCKVIEETKPDLIILTGDVVYPSMLLTLNNDNLSALKIIANVIESYKTPWTMCFGNHDAESGAKYSKSELCDYLKSDELEYCLFDRGPSNLIGMGNHAINIYNSDDTLNSTLVLFDNAEYSGSTQISGHDPISQGQTDWYTNVIETMNTRVGSTVQSFIYYHVPGKEYADAWDAYREGDQSITYYYGWANETGEKVSSPNEISPLYDQMVALESTKGVFCGHNHLNDFSIKYNGIRYTCGQTMDYTAYSLLPNFSKLTELRGGTVLKLKGTTSEMTDSFEISQVKLQNIG